LCQLWEVHQNLNTIIIILSSVNKKILAVTVSAVLVASLFVSASLQLAEARHKATNVPPAHALTQVFNQLALLDAQAKKILALLEDEFFGLEEIKLEVIDIQNNVTVINDNVDDVLLALEDKPTIVCASDKTPDTDDLDDLDNQDSIVITAHSVFKINAIYVNFTDPNDDADVDYAKWTVTIDGTLLELPGLGKDPSAGSHEMELLRMDDQGDLTDGASIAEIAVEEVDIDVAITAPGADDTNESLIVTACAWIAQVDKDSFAVDITT
jgi:hypothetical protein